MVIKGSLDHFQSVLLAGRCKRLLWRVERVQMSSLKTEGTDHVYVSLQVLGCVHRAWTKTWPFQSFHRSVTTRCFNYNSSKALLQRF